MKNFNNGTIVIIGLGYVGLPLAVEFGKQRKVIGFDINTSRIAELQSGFDNTLEVEEELLASAKSLSFTNDINDIEDASIYIVTVPTPIDEHKKPDLSPLINASTIIGQVIAKGDVVIYESTVYPGATEDDCVSVIEQVSGLIFNQDFFAGYSPERINPGDKVHRLPTIKKITSGSTPEVAEAVDQLYRSIITAGTHKAESIRVAESAKIIENIQRDVNIALTNELYQIFERMDIDTNQVIEAAATKWNFMKLKPGLVGGHCIGVDPYYLLHRSQSIGYIPDLMRTAREINDGMPEFIVQQFFKALMLKKINPIGLKVLLLGFGFKENCPDLRNTKVLDLYNALCAMGLEVDIFDPLVDKQAAQKAYQVDVLASLEKAYDVGILAVPHREILEMLEGNKIEFVDDFIFDFKKCL